ncbi:MAG: hypothetical protein IJX80_00975 [Clostridia bacterium]|nr:hypothetical protein [Clostridia bacterium]
MKPIWSYFMQLGHNMWRDEWSRVEFRGPIQTQVTGRYFETMYTDREVWRQVIDFLPSCGINTVVIDIGEGLQYETHPEISIPGAWSREELQVELARMRAMGLEPVPKLNFSSYHDAWLGEYSRMLGTRKYYEVVGELIDEVCEVFGNPRLFHLGLDEEYIPDHRKGITVIRSEDVWYHDLYFYIECLEKRSARPWIWADPHRAHTESFEKKVPKECILSEGCYERLVGREKTEIFSGLRGANSILGLAACGYDQIPCVSTWACHQNAAQMLLFFEKEGIANEHLLGFLDASWQRTDRDSLYTLLNDAHRMKYAKELFERLHPDRKA